MKCHELAQRIEQLHADATPRDVARACLLLTNEVDDLPSLADQKRLSDTWQQVGMRLQAVTDQHAAMTEELDEMAGADLGDVTLEQIWTLIRAIKVQSQVLQLYVGPPEAEDLGVD